MVERQTLRYSLTRYRHLNTAAILWLVGILSVTACQKASRTPPLVDAALAEVDKGKSKSKQSERSRRDTLDKTVWANEVLAQAHEAVFVELWDRLRGEPKAAHILGTFPFERLRVCKKTETTAPNNRPLSCGWLSPKSWKSKLVDLQSLGYRLVQSEWHHRRFIPGKTKAGAQSIVKVTLHVENERRGSRHIIEGSMRVDWAASHQAGSPPRIDSIDALDLQFTHSTRRPPFVGEVIFSSRTTPVLPLVVEDLDFNGFPDIALPGLNILLRNTAGSLTSEPLFDHPLPRQMDRCRCIAPSQPTLIMTI